ncbi:b(0,+)-type amino acid transporter 1-like [Trichosurus vulpecula]|uniref:b(0,+)-type amino acid transporter 1-like n=1 Tax=Trichosurus vulpecula TaxID=9337 RepID=UPI00186B3B76|nr:b(0,+)-type amino acid transporter 1-like [Trichosurus vulpecula]
MKEEEERPPFPRDAEPAKLRLRRELGLASAVSLIAGCMIGAGIFMNPQHVLYQMGSPGGSLLIWAACGILATLGALCYAELGTLITESGGDYIYILRTFGSLPAFLVIYVSILLVRPAAIAAMSLTFAEYVAAPFYPGCTSLPEVLVKCVASACIMILTLVNCRSVRLATGITNLCTLAKVLALLVIIGGGLWVLVQGHMGETLQNAFAGTTQQLGSISIAFYQGLWSFNGWNNLNLVTEELRNADKTLVRALVISIPLVTGLYILVNLSYMVVMSPSDIRDSSALAVTWGNQILGDWAWLVPVSVALSTFGSVNGAFFSGSRVCYVAAREGHMPGILSMAHIQHLTPSPALTFTSVVALIMIIPGNFSSIVNFCSFILWMIHGTTISCLLYLKVKKKDLPRSYKVPIVIPVIMLLASIYLVLAPIIDQPQMEFLYVFLFTLSGLVLYFPIIYFGYQPQFLQEATVQLQLFLEVAPTTKNVD